MSYKPVFNFNQKSSVQDLLYAPPKQRFKYYQICSFPNPWTNKYKIKRFIFNEKSEIISIEEGEVNQKQYKRFVEEHKPNQYKIYNAYDLNYIPEPQMGEISIAQSPLFMEDADYTGYAKF